MKRSKKATTRATTRAGKAAPRAAARQAAGQAAASAMAPAAAGLCGKGGANTGAVQQEAADAAAGALRSPVQPSTHLSRRPPQPPANVAAEPALDTAAAAAAVAAAAAASAPEGRTGQLSVLNPAAPTAPHRQPAKKLPDKCPSKAAGSKRKHPERDEAVEEGQEQQDPQLARPGLANSSGGAAALNQAVPLRMQVAAAAEQAAKQAPAGMGEGKPASKQAEGSQVQQRRPGWLVLPAVPTQAPAGARPGGGGPPLKWRRLQVSTQEQPAVPAPSPALPPVAPLAQAASHPANRPAARRSGPLPVQPLVPDPLAPSALSMPPPAAPGAAPQTRPGAAAAMQPASAEGEAPPPPVLAALPLEAAPAANPAPPPQSPNCAGIPCSGLFNPLLNVCFLHASAAAPVPALVAHAPPPAPPPEALPAPSSSHQASGGGSLRSESSGTARSALQQHIMRLMLRAGRKQQPPVPPAQQQQHHQHPQQAEQQQPLQQHQKAEAALLPATARQGMAEGAPAAVEMEGEKEVAEARRRERELVQQHGQQPEGVLPTVPGLAAEASATGRGSAEGAHLPVPPPPQQQGGAQLQQEQHRRDQQQQHHASEELLEQQQQQVTGQHSGVGKPPTAGEPAPSAVTASSPDPPRVSSAHTCAAAVLVLPCCCCQCQRAICYCYLLDSYSSFWPCRCLRSPSSHAALTSVQSWQRGRPACRVPTSWQGRLQWACTPTCSSAGGRSSRPSTICSAAARRRQLRSQRSQEMSWK